MMFWVLAALLTAIVLTAVIWPLLRPAEETVSRHEHDLAVYRDQLAEIDRDLQRGVLSPSEAGAARIEVSRRMLAADRREERARDTGKAASARPVTRTAKVTAAAMVVVVPLATVGVYLVSGSPHIDSLPFAERDPAEREARARAMAETEALSRELQTTRQTDLAGWVELGQRWTELSMFDLAVDAYERAVGLSEGDPRVVSAYGESLVNAGSGTVTRQAIEAFRQVVSRAPNEPRALYYLGLAEVQAGRDEAALEHWQQLAGVTPPNAPWLPLLTARMEDLAQRLDRDFDDIMPALAEIPRGPSAADMLAAQDMSGEDRSAMIEGMVAGLAARLEETPDDLDGWMRLARSYEVLGRPAEAAEAMRRATEIEPGNVDLLYTLADLLLQSADTGIEPEGFAEVMDRIAAIDPDDPRSLWFRGLRALQDGDTEAATAFWERLLETLPAGTPAADQLRSQIRSLQQG